MYSAITTKQTLDRRAPKLSFDLKPRSIAESAFYLAHFNSFLDRETGALPPGFRFSHDEIAYIQSERILCKFDFVYWCQRYGFIKSTLGLDTRDDVPDIVAPIKFNTPQKIVLDVWAEMEEMGVAIMMLQLKARQLGMSSLAELAIAHRVLFWKEINALVAAATPDTTRKMSDMIMRAVDLQPFWLIPPYAYYKTGEMLLNVSDHKSTITLQHGAQYTGLARGDTPNIAHLSEVSSFNNPHEDVDSALMQAMHEEPSTFLVLESTAMQLEDWWHKKWRHYTEAWPKREGRLCPLFLPWFIGDQVWPAANWLRGHPPPTDWDIPDEIERHARQARSVVTNDPRISKYLGADWQMPVSQKWFYYCEIKEARATKSLGLKLREMPTTAMEAFQTANTAVFDAEIIMELDSLRIDPIGCYGLECSSFPLALWPEKRDKLPGAKPISVKAEWATPKLAFDLVPLKLDGFPSCPWENRIFMWEAPQSGYEYYLGVDVAYGLDQDRCTIQILKKGDINRPAIQVAEYASGLMDPVNLAYVVAVLATLYTTGAGEPRVIIECRGPGDQTQVEMQRWGWGYFHIWEAYDRRKRHQSNVLGWYTNSSSRDRLVVKTNKAIKDLDIAIYSPWLIDELRTLSKGEFQASLRADEGAHDDRYMALGMAFYSAHCWEAMMGRAEYIVNQRARLGLDEKPPSAQETWEKRWQSGQPMFDLVLPTPVDLTASADANAANPAIARTLDDPIDFAYAQAHQDDGTYW